MNPLHHPILELQIKLKKIGFTNCETVTDTCGNYIRHTPWFDTWEYNPCPSVMEMLDVMPHSIPIEWLEHLIQYDNATTYYFLSISKGVVQYANQARRVQLVYFNVERNDERSIPNALAEMIIWLVEKKLLSFDK